MSANGARPEAGATAGSRLWLVVGLTLVLQGGADAEPLPDATRARLATVVVAGHRSDGDRRRDRFRHSVETLLFFGIRDDMTVVELTPGAGWYRRILAPFPGFRWVAASEINANPKDYPKGVWTLPPSYAAGKVDRQKYAVIGESDRRTLRFIKPAR